MTPTTQQPQPPEQVAPMADILRCLEADTPMLSSEAVKAACVLLRTQAAEIVRLREGANELCDALQWCLECSPSPCRCIPFSTPPHVCVRHRILAHHAPQPPHVEGGGK